MTIPHSKFAASHWDFIYQELEVCGGLAEPKGVRLNSHFPMGMTKADFALDSQVRLMW